MIDVMRHGDTGQPSYRGQLDDPLSETGWRQVRAAVVARQWDRIVSSTLRRCADFAGELAAQRGLPLTLDARLVEYAYGDWQGVPIAELERRDPVALQRYWEDPARYPPPNGEPLAAFGARVAAAFDDIARAWPHERVLVVTHGAVIRWLRCRLEGRPYDDMIGMDVPNASLHRIAWPPVEVPA